MSRTKTFTLVAILVIASLILAACGTEAVITKEDAVASCAPRLVDSWNAVTGEVKCQQVDVPASTTSDEQPLCSNNDGGTYAVGQHEWIMGVENVCTADGQGNASFVPVATTTPMPTATLATLDSDLVYLVGGRLVNGGGVEVIAVTTLGYLENETSLQMFFNQLVPTGFANTLNIPSEEEICNDGGCGQWLVYQRNGTWQVIEISRSFNISENFSQISCIRFTDFTLTVWVNDAGQPGSWAGNCTGTYQIVYTKATLEQMRSDPNFAPYVQALLRAMDGESPFNGKIEIKEVFQK